MALEKDILRNALAGPALSRLGISGATTRIWASQVTAASEEAYLETLPVEGSTTSPLMDAAGNLYFFPDMDPPDGPYPPL